MRTLSSSAPARAGLSGKARSHMSQPFRVLFVCSANLCRSVTAAEFARRCAERIDPTTVGWAFESAGTDVAPGMRLPPEIARQMRELEIPLRDRPRPVSEISVREADLILTAERYHRAVIAQRFPFAVRRTYTLLQFAQLVDAGRLAEPEVAGEGPAGLHDLARTGRSHVHAMDDETIDIGDPVRSGSAAAMIECAGTISSALERIFD